MTPLSNYILVEIDGDTGVTAGGLVLSTAEKATSGTVVTVGPGKEDKETGVVLPVPVTPGQHVMWGRYEGAELTYCGKKHTLIRDVDIAVVWDDDFAQSHVIGGKVLLKALKPPAELQSGLIVKSAMNDNDVPVEGVVLAKGDGALTRDGTPVPIPVDVGDCVKFRDFDTVDVKIDGVDCVVVNAANIICKWQAPPDEE